MNQKQKYRTPFKTTRRGLDAWLFPMQLWRKAKKFGVWDPQGLSFEQDIADWQRLGDRERDLLLRLTAQFQAGEEVLYITARRSFRNRVNHVQRPQPGGFRCLCHQPVFYLKFGVYLLDV